MSGEQKSAAASRGHVRYLIAFMLFAATTVNYADRASLSIVGPAMQSQLHIDPITLGYIFSAFGWAYVIAQLPGGWLLDRFGSRAVYAASILLWSLFTLLQGAVGLLAGGLLAATLFTLRLLVGLAEAPAFPGNSRIVAAWFPGGARLGRRRRYCAQGDDWTVRRTVQYFRQYRGYHHPDRHRLHRRGHRIIRRGAGLRWRECAARRYRLHADCRTFRARSTDRVRAELHPPFANGGPQLRKSEPAALLLGPDTANRRSGVSTFRSQ